VAGKFLNFHFKRQSSSKNIFLKRASAVKKNYYEQITNGFFSFALFPRGQRGDLNFKND
jgi:hypothetical protein